MTKHVRTPAGPGLRRAQSRCNLWPQMCSCLIKPAKPTCLVVVVVVVARHPGRLARTRASDLYAQTNASAERPMTSSAARRKHFCRPARLSPPIDTEFAYSVIAAHTLHTPSLAITRKHCEASKPAGRPVVSADSTRLLGGWVAGGRVWGWPMPHLVVVGSIYGIDGVCVCVCRRHPATSV